MMDIRGCTQCNKTSGTNIWLLCVTLGGQNVSKKHMLHPVYISYMHTVRKLWVDTTEKKKKNS